MIWNAFVTNIRKVDSANGFFFLFLVLLKTSNEKRNVYEIQTSFENFKFPTLKRNFFVRNETTSRQPLLFRPTVFGRPRKRAHLNANAPTSGHVRSCFFPPTRDRNKSSVG